MKNGILWDTGYFLFSLDTELVDFHESIHTARAVDPIPCRSFDRLETLEI
jgi:hypothetical protein